MQAAQLQLQQQQQNPQNVLGKFQPGSAPSSGGEEPDESTANCLDLDSSAKSEVSSPLGFSSVGSPAGSVNSSPMTPGQQASSAWLSLMTATGGYGAFKPPVLQATKSHDPRDAKHPLSICQLTSRNDFKSQQIPSVSAAAESYAANSASSSLAAAICAASAVANSAALLGLRWRQIRFYAVCLILLRCIEKSFLVQELKLFFFGKTFPVPPIFDFLYALLESKN